MKFTDIAWRILRRNWLSSESYIFWSCNFQWADWSP